MVSRASHFSDRSIRYQSLGDFYAADRRRRVSPEQDVGLWWRVGAHGPIYRAAWVCDTGELYVIRLGPLQSGKGEIRVLGRAHDRGELEEALEGWRDACPQPDSMTWLCHRTMRLAPPERPARTLARPPGSHLHRLATGGPRRPRRPEERALPSSNGAA